MQILRDIQKQIEFINDDDLLIEWEVLKDDLLNLHSEDIQGFGEDLLSSIYAEQDEYEYQRECSIYSGRDIESIYGVPL